MLCDIKKPVNRYDFAYNSLFLLKCFSTFVPSLNQFSMDNKPNRPADDSFSKLISFEVPVRPLFWKSSLEVSYERSDVSRMVDFKHHIHVRVIAMDANPSYCELITRNFDWSIPSHENRFVCYEGNFVLSSHGFIPIHVCDDKVIECINALMYSPLRLKDKHTGKYLFSNTTYLILYSVLPEVEKPVFDYLPYLNRFSRAFIIYNGDTLFCRTLDLSNLSRKMK